MPTDPRKRQKKLEKRAAKQKEKKKALARRPTDEMALRIQRASSYPLLHCLASGDWQAEGMANVLVSRELPDRRVLVAYFLVDVWCLGVKDAYLQVAGRLPYESDCYSKLLQMEYEMLSLPCARKFVEGAAAYAEKIGLHPHADYFKARPIFGDADPGQCEREFAYGKDGKPYFVAGPYDSPERCGRIIATLEDHCGPGGFHFLMPGGFAQAALASPGDFYELDTGEEDEE